MAKRPSWLVDSKRIAKKIKSASERDPRNIKWISNPTKACPRCNYVIDNSDVIQEWPGLPHGVKFDPTDQELLRHLVAKVGNSGVNPHPLINEFIPTVEKDDGICYTHPWKLPGVKQDGSVAHFFHRTFKAYNTGTRKRRKISADDHCDVRWHKTGKTKPVHLDGEHLGCKKIMVLYVSATKGSKPEKTNWVMHQYHLGTGEDEKDGEFVVSKIFYQQQLRPCDRKGEPIFETADEVVGEFENVGCAGSATPDCHDEHQNLIQSSEENSLQTKVGYDPVNDNNDINPELEGFAIQNDADHHGSTRADNQGIAAPDSQSAEEPKWWEGESQFLLDSQQLADGIALCDEFLHSQSSCADDEGKSSRPCLSDYARMGVENLKRDLEECQKLSRDGDGRDLEECKKLNQGGDGSNGSNIELDTALDMRLSQLDCGDGSNIELDTASEMRLSQIEFGSQDSFMAWAEDKLS